METSHKGNSNQVFIWKLLKLLGTFVFATIIPFKSIIMSGYPIFSEQIINHYVTEIRKRKYYKKNVILTASEWNFLTFLKEIRHAFGFGIEFLDNKDIGIFRHCMVIDFISRYCYQTYFSPISTS